MSGGLNSLARMATGPMLSCRPVASFNRTDLASVRAAFETAAHCGMLQAWQATLSRNFAPAFVRVGWQHNTVLVFAELTDMDIFTRASGLNQRMWELGDTMEIFLRPDGQKTYYEFHVTPNNQRLQLRIPDPAAIRCARGAGKFDEFLIPQDSFQSRVWVEDQQSRWCVFVQIPAKLICGSGESLAGSQWHYSFSRYDYTRGVHDPVLSSSSPHLEADFHRQHEWGVLQFTPTLHR